MRGVSMALCLVTALALGGCETGEGGGVPEGQPYVRSIATLPSGASTVVTITADDRVTRSELGEGARVPRITRLPPRAGRHAEARALVEAAFPGIRESQSADLLPLCMGDGGTRGVEVSPPVNGLDGVYYDCWEDDVLDLMVAVGRLMRE
ncbi:hypothetical protein [Histidinibacterium lentulum]|uniref:Lipoprotein n=1 Tax=Histidinibacterium lentulum TaxID=2480588 RepID=A0A3N2R9W7_9RHOB|nr:hypothetical protein [Histidinibacterium lentulum]ROU04272.1 hypothetical protein EAT49_02465 [Histidinibacterium lentulum]